MNDQEAADNSGAGPADDGAAKRLVISTDRRGLSCTVTILPGRADATPDATAVTAMLEAQEVSPDSIDRGAIEALLARAGADHEIEHAAVVARGTAPENGLHAGFTLDAGLAERLARIAARRGRSDADPVAESADQPSGAQADGADENGIDYRSQSAFVIVAKGAALGVVTEPTPGIAGINVRGEVIPAKKGRKLRITLDDTTAIVDGTLVSLVDGVLRSSIDRVRVDPTLTIIADVNYSTGNLDFPGPVVINGGVKDHFRVTAGGPVRVDQLVEAAEILTRGDLLLSQGMAGREIGRLWVGGDLRAGYIDGVRATVGGACLVVNEIKESEITVLNGVESPSCAFYGGRLESRKRVDLGVVGSSGGVSTELAIGLLPGVEAMIARLLAALESIDHQRSSGAAELEALVSSGRSLTATQAERLGELQHSEARADEMAGKVATGAMNLLGAIRSLGRPALHVHRALHRGVRLRLRHAEFVISATHNGPVVIDLDPNGVPRCFPNGVSLPHPISRIAEPAGVARADPVAQLTLIAERGGWTDPRSDPDSADLPEDGPGAERGGVIGDDLGGAAA